MSKYLDKIISKKRNIEFDEGKHCRAKLGFILMSTDLAGESDFFTMAPKDVGVHITRLKTEDYTTNETLSRTLITSVTTLLALFSIYIFGGAILKGFSFAMIIGVIIGTFSSIFVATPILNYTGVSQKSILKEDSEKN